MSNVLPFVVRGVKPSEKDRITFAQYGENCIIHKKKGVPVGGKAQK
jgi:hypothetical protein